MHIADELIYQIFVPSFYDSDGDGIGDLCGVKEKLPYLASLGVKCISLSQIFETTDRNSLYALTDFSALDPAIGVLSDLEDLFREAHAHDLRILLTIPLYAVSSAHPWFEKASASEAEYNLFKDYFIWKKGEGSSGKRPPKKVTFNPSNAEYRYIEDLNEWYLAEENFPILNFDNPRARREITDTLSFWKEKGADGFALFGASLLLKKEENAESPQKVTEESFLIGKGYYKLLREIKEKKILDEDDLLLLENAVLDPDTAKYLLEEAALVHAVGTSSLISANATKEKGKFRIVDFLSGYKEKMTKSSSSAYLNVFEDEIHRRIVNALGISAKLREITAKAFCALLFTAPSVPFLYYGQEIGMTGNAEKTKKAENAPFQWDNKTNAGFTESRFPWTAINENYSDINLAAEIREEDSVLNFYRKMIDFRKSSDILRKGEFIPCLGKAKDVIAFIRRYEGRELFIICSLSEKEINYKVPAELLESEATAVASNYNVVSHSIHATIGLRPFEARIYAPKSEGKEIALR